MFATGENDREDDPAQMQMPAATSSSTESASSSYVLPTQELPLQIYLDDDDKTISDLFSDDDSVKDPDFIIAEEVFYGDLCAEDDPFDCSESILLVNDDVTYTQRPLQSEIENVPLEVVPFSNCPSSQVLNETLVPPILFVAAYPGPIYCEENVRHNFNDISTTPTSTFVAQLSGEIFVCNDMNILLNGDSTAVMKKKLKHPILDRCFENCKRKCRTFSETERKYLWNEYWNMTLQSRRQFLHKYIQIIKVNRRTCDDGGQYVKNETRLYFLPKNDQTAIVPVPVCKSFFLKTLGYKTDGVITEISKAVKRKNVYQNADDLKKKRAKKPKLNRDLIEEHILSYKPTVSHYRRHNAPLTRYLPRQLTVTDMFKDFKIKNPTFNCSMEIYRKKIKEMRISLHCPKSDKCEDCLLYEIEKEKYENVENIPEEIKNKHVAHKLKADSAIEYYKKDALLKNTDNVKYFSMDLQKVILIPHMPDIKEAFFLSKLICFNLTFAILDKSATSSYCVLWNEAIAGRKANNIVDAIVALIETERDVLQFTFWADNCSAQNKNWTLFTSLVLLINCNENQADSITIKYLTKGHTHMTADSIHGNIENKMRREKNIYDFDDFKSVVTNSRKNLKVVEITKKREWTKKKRYGSRTDPIRTFNLSAVVEVKFVRGSRNLFFKNKFEDSFTELDFLLKRYSIHSLPSLIASPRGIKQAKKDEIVSKLVPLMPESRKQFWVNLPTNETAADLTSEEQLIDSDED